MTAQGNRHRQQAPRPGQGRQRPVQGRQRPGYSGSGRAIRPAAVRRRQARRQARLRLAGWLAAAAAAAGLIIATALSVGSSSGTTQSSAVRAAPGFTLTSTSGKAVSLASYRGRDVVLYFSEGVGCDACFYQMTEFQSHAAELAKAGITVVPIVMNPAGQVRQETAAFGIRTPYLIDTTGSVSRAYGMLGKGMHPGLPGHGFILIDARGMQRWHGEYPSMYLSTAGLITQVKNHL